MNALPKAYRENYLNMLARADYYRWAAGKGFVLGGNDPITGIPHDRLRFFSPEKSRAQAEAKLVHKVQARYWIAEARLYRLRYGL